MTNATSARMLNVPWRSRSPEIRAGRSSNRIILEIKEILTGDTFFISSTKRAERPTDNSRLSSGSFKAAAVTWISHFYFIHLYASARQTTASLGRQDERRGVCVSVLRDPHTQKPLAIISHHNQAFLHLVAFEPKAERVSLGEIRMRGEKRKLCIYIHAYLGSQVDCQTHPALKRQSSWEI